MSKKQPVPDRFLARKHNYFAVYIHLGCWVPAKDAVIPIIDGIYTRIQTLDSIGKKTCLKKIETIHTI